MVNLSNLLALTLLAPPLAQIDSLCEEELASADTFRARTTAYTHSESDHIKYGRRSAKGTILRSRTDYTSAAADWSFLPVDTVFKIKGCNTTFVVDD